MKKWIAVVTRVEARIFESKDFSLVTKLKNPLGHEKNRAMNSGKPGVGRSKFSGSMAIHNMTGEKSPHEDAAIAFGKRIGEYLNKQMDLNRFSDLLLVAEPKMLGRVKAHMDKKVMAHTECSAKDLGKLSAHELKKAITISGV